MALMIAAALAALAAGFLAGLLTFRKAQHWCPDCGSHLACPDRHRHQPRPGTVPR